MVFHLLAAPEKSFHDFLPFKTESLQYYKKQANLLGLDNK
ncbi:hypothetical protein NC99_09210 [Sunxiuqinia dokdonensis]|uniref:Uncharacterized protein n=1 Tax=Sunxiuqinia dokdonensis TaxID=1409788 RepID=A0A0L8VCS6_9BACT|nr:hypothetical protein NC99_09210 [Sunxiuqinia dokdonensis]